MELLYFKLYTNEEVIAPARRVDNGWIINNPATLVHMKDYKIGLATWLPYTKVEAGSLLPFSAVMLALDVADDMAEYYTKWMNPDMSTVIKVDENGDVQTNK